MVWLNGVDVLRGLGGEGGISRFDWLFVGVLICRLAGGSLQARSLPRSLDESSTKENFEGGHDKSTGDRRE